MNNLYREGIISDQQNRGMLVCLPKKPDPTRIEDYRPLTLMNTTIKCSPKSPGSVPAAVPVRHIAAEPALWTTRKHGI